MTDISSGLFALGGALIGAAGTQVTAIISAVSKGRARKAKSERATADARSAKRRPLYESMIYDADNADQVIGREERTRDRPDQVTRRDQDQAPALTRQALKQARNSAVSVQIDGSEEARAVAETMLVGIDDLWCQIEDDTERTADAMNKARVALVTARVRMIKIAREDIGV